MTDQKYLIGLGSNQRHIRFGSPRSVLYHAVKEMEDRGLIIDRLSQIFENRPIGPSNRRYANATATISCDHLPDKLLTLLKSIEACFGKRRGQTWSRRVLDLDIILWNKGSYSAAGPPLIIPHPLFRERSFVLCPASHIAPKWRDPISGRTIAQLQFRNRQARETIKK